MKEEHFCRTLLQTGKKTLYCAGIVSWIPLSAMLGVYAVQDNQLSLTYSETAVVVQREAATLGIEEDVVIQSTTSLPRNLQAIALHHPDEEAYVIAFSHHARKEIVIRHELTHIAAHHNVLTTAGDSITETEQLLSTIPIPSYPERVYDFCVREFQANMYALTGLQLF